MRASLRCWIVALKPVEMLQPPLNVVSTGAGQVHQIARDQRRREGQSMKLSPTAKEAVANGQTEISQEKGAKACAGAPRTANTPKRRSSNGLTSASRQRTYDHAICGFVAYRVGSSGFQSGDRDRPATTWTCLALVFGWRRSE
jgi:hypothetical protein